MSTLAITLIWGGLGIVVVLGVSNWRLPNKLSTTLTGATAALGHVQEWAKWMSGIQTAALGGLLFFVFNKDSGTLRAELPAHGVFAILTLIFLGGGLFASAWILASLPSMAIRIHGLPQGNRDLQAQGHRAHREDGPNDAHTQEGPASPDLDIYEQGLFGWSKSVSLGYVLTVQHWLWAIGLLAMATHILLFFATPNRAA
jgi:hypothetical protein